jgi:hypothetical protein
LQSLVHLPGDGSDRLSHWSLGIGNLLRRDRQVLEALQTSIVRTSFLPETILDYCTAREKPESKRTGAETIAFNRITSAMGLAP